MTIKNTLFITLQYLIPQHLLSRAIGRAAAAESPWLTRRIIPWFVARYNVDMTIAANPDLASYGSFNAFFTRALQPGVRPIDNAANAMVSPADGVISQVGRINAGQILQAKGVNYSAASLLADATLADRFANGSFATVYLSPRDYHRVHMPFAGTLVETIYVPGKLFSVNAVTAEGVPNLFARNERLVCVFDTAIGTMVVVLVGAMIVAGIECVATGKIKPSPSIQRQQHQLTLAKGAELGRFFLCSTAIVFCHQ